MREPTDHELLAGLAGGDSEALAVLYRRHKDSLLTVSFHLLGDRHAAEDLLQDLFVELVRRAKRLEVRGEVRHYLVRAAVNRARDELRRRRPQVGTVREPVDAGREDPLADVAAALAALPTEQREVVILHVFEELPFRAIAALLDIPANTVMSRWRYARGHLERRLRCGQGVDR